MDFIIDLNGDKIEVTDLEKALTQAEDYKNFCAEQGEESEFFRNRNAYWQDVYDKLMKLKKRSI